MMPLLGIIPNRENEPMKTNHKLTLAVLAGVLIGAGGAKAIYAQQAKAAPGYVIAEIDVTDPATLPKYAEKVPETLAPFNHHYVVLGGKTQALEGAPPKTIVVIAFDSAEKAREWYDSPAYAAIKPIRQSSAKSRIFIAEGVAPQ
jgi:uncharacterized protein (DUF1330 family)